jgi:pyridoxal phosphate enzyme (YggS family)
MTTAGAARPASAGRREELRLNLADIRDRIAVAAAAAGRPAGEITLIAVSKTWPAADVVALHGLGVTDFAENREQEARPKVADVTDQAARAGWPGRVAGPPVPPRWHFVGQLQRNKVPAVARWAHWVHSVDRAPLVAALSRAAVAHGREIVVCLQVLLDQDGADAGRGGAPPAGVPALGDLVAGSQGLVLAGVMGVAPRDVPARPAFARLREVSEVLRRQHPDAWVISAGMSGDLAEAVAESATHLRIGTALFGQRRGVP